ncbi:TetR/AcrR family transcriptional regulator [Kitasatospora sp. NBC_01539]|uniref:TetR/AcrR family transcriptional regulator n=1 Tax=Kitasatospora sp. NBC_01539 TaxID=2903577 RepID=UPI0038602BA0
MGRRPEPQIRQRLLDACTGYALEHGLPDRLRPLATVAGTSERMLIYHFGTRDALLRDVLGQARRRQVEAFTDLLRVRPEEPYPAHPAARRRPSRGNSGSGRGVPLPSARRRAAATPPVVGCRAGDAVQLAASTRSAKPTNAPA